MKTTKHVLRNILGNPFIQSLVALAISYSWSRRLLNAAYLKLTPYQKKGVHSLFAKIFRNKPRHVTEGVWKIEFQEKTVLLPLSSEQMWHQWDTAVSIIGHSIELKETYRNFLDSPEKLELFIDIGANYGTHSLLFLVHGIHTLTFEPNSACNTIFASLCELNSVKPNLYPVALGEHAGFVDLFYPTRDTWLGSTNTEVIDRLSACHELVTERVEQKKLDDYLPLFENKNALIKIDTEGNELAVLRGSRKTLRQTKPRVIFESLNAEDRTQLFEFFNLHNYQVHSLPINPAVANRPLEHDQFLQSSSPNFIAIPK